MTNLLHCLCLIVAGMRYICRTCEKYNSGQNLRSRRRADYQNM